MKGLRNLGNTCYLNAVIQVLFNTPGFVSGLRSSLLQRGALRRLVESLSKLSVEYEGPSIVGESLREFVSEFHECHREFGYGQHDPHEYMTFLLRALHDTLSVRKLVRLQTTAPLTPADELELLSIKGYISESMSLSSLLPIPIADGSVCYSSFVMELFSGQYRFETECQSCKYISTRFESFTTTEVPIGNVGRNVVTVGEILTEMTGVTSLEDLYECDGCKHRTECKRRCTYWRLPRIMVLTLKRMIPDRDGRVVCAEPVLDMSGYLSAPRSQPHRYELYGVINHVGSSGHGHCYAEMRVPNPVTTSTSVAGSRVWMLADDDLVSVPAPLDGGYSYILFYVAGGL